MTQDVGPSDALVRDLAEQAAARYENGFARRFARAKLTRDPLFATLLRTGAIPDAGCLIDLGCGQGLLAAWLHAARGEWTADGDGANEGQRRWPPTWSPPPKVSTYLGIDRSRFDIRRARAALPPFARVFRGDLRTLGPTMLDRCDVVTLLDVLHYLAPPQQEALLAAVTAGLPPWGVVVLRIGDGGALASWRGQFVDLAIALLRGAPRLRLHRRSVAGWTALFEAHGFCVEVLDDPRAAGGRTFANVLLRASRPDPGPPSGASPLR